MSRPFTVELARLYDLKKGSTLTVKSVVHLEDVILIDSYGETYNVVDCKPCRSEQSDIEPRYSFFRDYMGERMKSTFKVECIDVNNRVTLREVEFKPVDLGWLF